MSFDGFVPHSYGSSLITLFLHPSLTFMFSVEIISNPLNSVNALHLFIGVGLFSGTHQSIRDHNLEEN